MKLAILGTGTTLRHAPFKDTSFTFYGPAYLWNRVPRLDVGFEIHDEAACRAEGFWDTLAQCPVPIYMQQVYPTIPSSIAYPLAEVERRFRPASRDKVFTTGIPAYMLAFALLQTPAPTTIHFFGVDMVQGSEYEWQLRSVEFFAGICIGRGIELVIPAESELLKTRFLYGYHDRARLESLAELRERLAYFKMQRDSAAANEEADRAARLKYEGIITDTEYHLKHVQL